jgi:hypothetical protein
MNACGGCAPLPLSPAQRCGACGDGVVDCAGEDALACSCDERRWTQIVAGDGVTCGVGGLNGAVSCWGDDNNTVTGFPGASWVQLALGDRHLCGVDVRGSVTCFGDNDRGQLFPTVLVGANVIALVAAGDAACALTVELDPGNNHNLYCWGAVPVGYVEGLVPEGRFEGVALGIGHLCVWGSEGVACIGDDAQGQATPPPALADTQEVVAGLYYTCALSRGGEVRCWGRAPLVANTPTERFSRLFGGFGAVCGLNDAGISCWGEELPARRLFEGGDWQRAVVGRYHICGLDGDRALSCVGELNYGQHSPPLEPLRGLISTDFVSCGLRLDGTPACWGALETVAAPPAVAMLSLDLGPQHGCAVLPDAGLLCWGDLAGGRTAPPEGRQWRAVQVDSQSSCGLTLDGEALCWGDGALAQAAPPVGLFVELSAGEGFACARRADGEVVCWGRGDQGALQVPEEQRFVRIKAATDGACGVTVNGEVRCWGRNLLGEGIPTGGFVDLAPAQWQDARDPLAPRWRSHHCALDAGGEMVCFVGTGIYGDDVAIPGRFRELTAGAIHTCAARASDGIVQCTQHPLADMPR